MIARFWDALFDYADKAKADGDQLRLDICHEIEDLLQKAYDDGMDNKTMITNYKPKNTLSKLVASIPDIEIYKDPTDGKMFWELDGKYFDYPEEVIKYLINLRSDATIRDMGRFKGTFLEAVLESIEDLKPGVVFQGKARSIAERVRKNK